MGQFSTVATGFLLLLCVAATGQRASAQPDPNQGPGGPILVITSPSTPFGRYYAEILRTEGLNEFAVSDIASVTATTLASYDLVILAGPTTLTAGQVNMFTTWVTGGGNLIAMRPDPQLDSLLGLTSTGATLSDNYMRVDTSTGAGSGIVSRSMQFHSVANRYTLNGASSIATLYSDAATATSNPAVSVRNVGTNGGHAAAFAYDLAASIVRTRQGNPIWAGRERDGFSPIRSDDMFFGAAVGDVQPDYVDLNNLVAIPQADEQQRLLANLILQMNLAKRPLPRFWYFPRGKKAVVVMTGDDHGNGGTSGRFNQQIAASPAGCSVANWECIRSTSYVFIPTPNMTNAQAVAYAAQGFEIGLHVNTQCGDYDLASLDTMYNQQINQFKAAYPGIPTLYTQRHHCIAFSDWSSAPKIQLKYGMRLDANYYFWPPGWVQDRPGHFTGSAMVMRFADLDGTLINVYNAPTQMTDESGQTYPLTIDALLDAAVGAQGYYGVYTVNSHTDTDTNPVSDAVVPSAIARGVPVVSSAQMLTWLDGRNSSSFSGIAWNGSTLTFSVTQATGANGLQVMVPRNSASGVLSGVTGPGGANVAFTLDVIKGVQYALFSASSGTYTAIYSADVTRPTITSTSPTNGAGNVAQSTTVGATFSEPMDPATITTGTVELRDGATLVPATVTYNASNRTATLTPTSPLSASTLYSAKVTTGVKDLSGNALAADQTWSFTTVSPPTCPCSAWNSSATPADPDVNDPNPVELGVKFRVDLNGSITGIRYYKGAANTGTHVGSLWSTSGQLLATATFNSETASGWQQVNFSTPVPVTANTVYVASYHTTSGNYAANNNFFGASGVDNGPVHLLQDGLSGGNGVYAYSSSSTFPNNTWQSSNYWVDVVFAIGGGGPTPLNVSSTTPINGAIGVAVGTSVSATFNRAIDAGTVNSSTFTLKNASGTTITGNYSVASATATFTPGAALAESATYTATLSTGIKDTNGVALAATTTWTFTTATTSPTSGPESAGWFSGDIHVHRSCGGSPEALSTFVSKMDPQNLAVISLLADSGNGEVQNPTTDLPLVNGQDSPVSTAGRIVHWDTEWHWDAIFTQYPHQALGGHIVSLGLTQAQQIWQEYTFPILNSARQQGGVAGFAHMQYLDGTIPQSLTCCTPIEYPVEVALGAADFISEDVADTGNTPSNMNPDAFIQAYYRLLNSGFRPGFAAGTDYPCGNGVLGSLLTYVQVANGQMTYRNWINGIKAGRTVVSRNGHREFLELKVNGNFTPGDEIPMAAAGSLPVSVKWTATQNLSGRIEIVSNGVVVASQQASVTSGMPVTFNSTVNFPKSGWVAARRMGSDGHQVHTAAVFVIVNGAPIRVSAADAQYFVQWMDNLLTKTAPGGEWNSFFPTSLNQVRTRYQNAKSIFEQRAAEATGPSPLSVTATTPAGGATGINVGTTTVSATFNNPLNATTVTTSSFTLRDQANTVIPASPSVSGNIATLTTAGLTASTTYTATLSTGVADTNGTTLAAAYSWSFTTAGPGGTGCTNNCTIWPSSTVPARVDDGADSSVELGVKFRSDVAGTITGIRFYKANTNTGTHTGTLWSAGGQLLATATFINETASGWQQVNFTTPVSITANTAYVASYHANTGHYSQDANYFASTGADNAPLHALATGVSGPNGVYAYGATTVFPNQTFNAANYWVDVVFSSGPAPTLSSIAVTPANPTIQAGGTQQFTATGTYSDNSTQNITSQVTWASATTTVATINASGLASGVAAGTSNISATHVASGKTGSTTLTVQAAAPAPLTITTTSPLPAGTVGTAYSVTLARSGGTGPFTWSMSSGSTLPGGLNLNASTGVIAGTPTAGGTFSFTVQVTDSATPTPATAPKLLTITIGGNTGFVAPTTQAAVTSGAGDNNGFETNPMNAFLTDGLFAVDANSGTGTGTGCTGTGKDKHLFYNYGFVSPVLPAGVTIRGIEVRLDARVNSTTSAPKMCVEISWNGGQNWTTAKSTPTLSTTAATYTLGGVADLWGTSWTLTRVNNTNFRVRITNVASSTARTFSLDGVAVRVTYQ